MNCETPGAAPPGWPIPQDGYKTPFIGGLPRRWLTPFGFPLGGLPLERRSPLEEVTCPFTWTPQAQEIPVPVLKRRGLGGAQAGVAVRRNHEHPLLVETQPPTGLLQRLGASAAPPGPGGTGEATPRGPQTISIFRTQNQGTRSSLMKTTSARQKALAKLKRADRNVLDASQC